MFFANTIKIQTGILCLLLCLPFAARAGNQEPIPTDKAGWIARLKKIREPQGDDWWALTKFGQIEPKLQLTVLQDGWSDFTSERLRLQLLARANPENRVEIRVTPQNRVEAVAPDNPFLLDALHLGATDKTPNVRDWAYSAIGRIVNRGFPTPEIYTDWRKSIEGKSLETVVGDAFLPLASEFVKGDDTKREALFSRMLVFSYSNSAYAVETETGSVRGMMAVGATSIRRRLALESGLVDVIADLLTPDHSERLQEIAFRFLVTFQPERAFLLKHEAALHHQFTQKAARGWSLEYNDLLTTLNTDWTTDLILQQLDRNKTRPNRNFALLDALSKVEDKRVIPDLIGWLAALEQNESRGRNLQKALQRLTGVKNRGGETDSDWWMDWWESNRASFLEAVRKRPVPVIANNDTPDSVFTMRRKRARFQIAGDANRAYWLLSTGLNSEAQGSLIDLNSGNVPEAQRPGLLVVLADSAQDIEKQRRWWQRTGQEALAGRYLLAFVIPPRPQPGQKTLWPLKPTGTASGSLTTEAFVQDVVTDAQTRFPLRKDRVFLVGTGEAGIAAYAAALQKSTPFRGFYLRSAAFRSALLPPLTAAKGRKFLLEHSPDDRSRPYFLVTAAQSLLKKAGANVRLTTYKPDKNAPFERPTPPEFAKAVLWLEGGK